MNNLEKKLRNELKHHALLMKREDAKPEQIEAIYLEARNHLKDRVNEDQTKEMRIAAVNVLIDFMKLKEANTVGIIN